MIVMAIVAHPTDAFDMVGGTLANHIARGDEVHVCFTHSRMHEDAFRLADRIREGQAQAEQKEIERESEQHIGSTFYFVLPAGEQAKPDQGAQAGAGAG